MKWFEGSIAEAVSSSKQKNAVFVVFIEGKDETSKTMLSAIDKPNVSNHLESKAFVSVKLESGSESHNQFTEIYKLVPVPSVFFIGHNGAPLEIIAGENSEDNLISKLGAAINKCIGSSEISSKESTVNSTNETSGPSTSNEKVQQSVPPEPAKGPPLKSQQEPERTTASAPSSPVASSSMNTPVPVEPEKSKPSSSHDLEADVEKASKDRVLELLEKKKEERKLQEERDEKEKEIERRKLGQVMMEAKRKQQDRELLDLKMERMKEKQAEKEAKQRVLDQIAQDRAERAARLASAANIGSPSSPPLSAVIDQEPRPAAASSVDVNTARLQFKMPDGQTRTHTFPSDTTLVQVRQFIDNNIVLPFREYQMATMFPRREFTVRDNNLDLKALQLLPSAVILIMPLQGNLVVSSGQSWPRMFMDMFWDLMQPLFTLSRYIQSFVWRGGNTTGGRNSRSSSPSPPNNGSNFPNQQQQQPPSRSGVRKRGNVHSLADNDSSNDENNTWNGNSTQQM